LLEQEVIPEFYDRDKEGMPRKWLGRIRESMARLTRDFSATRAIREYTENHYLTAASNYHERAADDSRLGSSLLHWQQELDQHWNMVRFGAVGVETHDGQHFFRVAVSPGALNPDHLKVELYADSVHGSRPDVLSMNASESGPDSAGAITYTCQVSATRASSDYTARISPHHANAFVPLEAGQILWQH
jgi:glycogen phosphorylase